MSNVSSFAAAHRAKNGPTTMRAELARRHEAEWQRIEEGDIGAHDRLMERVSAIAGINHISNAHRMLGERLDALG